MSRKKQVNQKITALYCRISLEDGGDNESMSISNHMCIRDRPENNRILIFKYLKTVRRLQHRLFVLQYGSCPLTAEEKSYYIKNR